MATLTEENKDAHHDPFYLYDLWRFLTKGFQILSYYSHLLVLPCVSKAMDPLRRQPNSQQCAYVVMCCQHNHHDTMRTTLTELNSKTNIRKNTTQTGLFIFLFKSFIKTLTIFLLIRGHHQISSCYWISRHNQTLMNPQGLFATEFKPHLWGFPNVILIILTVLILSAESNLFFFLVNISFKVILLWKQKKYLHNEDDRWLGEKISAF